MRSSWLGLYCDSFHFFRFKQLKEQEARKRQQREEEKRRAEVAANYRKEDKSVGLETRDEIDSINGDSTSLSRNASTSENYHIVNDDSTYSEVKADERSQTGKISDDHNDGEDQHVSDIRKKVKLASFGSKLNFSIRGQISFASEDHSYRHICDSPQILKLSLTSIFLVGSPILEVILLFCAGEHKTMILLIDQILTIDFHSYFQGETVTSTTRATDDKLPLEVAQEDRSE